MEVVGSSEETIKSLLIKLGNLLAEEYALIRGVRGDIQFINDELASMQAFLSNLSNSGDDHDDQTKDWMKQIRDVSYDIEDCVDDFAHGIRPDPRGNDLWSWIRRTIYEIQTWSLRRRVAVQITDLKERAKNVGERRGRYGVRDPENGKKKSILAGSTGYLAAENQQTTRQLISIKKPVGVKDNEKLEEWISYEDNKKKPGVLPIVGFDGVGKTTIAQVSSEDNKKKLGGLSIVGFDGVEKTTIAQVSSEQPGSEDNKKKLGVLSIVGFGGVGKTTIAQDLYRKYGDKFQHRAVVTVSQNSNHLAILKDILRQVKPQDNTEELQDNNSVNGHETSLIRWICGRIISPVVKQQEEEETNKSLEEELKKYLSNRYLLLIDDVWSSSTWQSMKVYFPENNNGSRIIVTTRFQAVATTCSAQQDNGYIHSVEVLSNGESRDLFHKSLLECNHTAESQQSKIPERVWGMCGGLPLAIVTMAGHVASNMLRTENEWTAVCNSLFLEPEKCHKPEDFMRIINFCYNDLPSDLKTCTLYLSIFPKGSKISSKRLIRRWIAEGFVTEKQGLSVEDVAETCFNQLIERKIVRPVEHSSNGRVKSCQVHDMVFEYIISKAAEEDFATVLGGHWSMTTRSNKVRRLSRHSTDSKHAKQIDGMNFSHVRSLTVFGSLDQLHFKAYKTGILQVLDLEGCTGFKENHISATDICEMTLLKYLSLRGTNIDKLPPKIGNLKYLETLDIRQTDIEVLPKTIIQLERINNILGGDKRTQKTLKLPTDVKGTMKGLRILSGIEIVNESNESTAALNLRDFTRLRKLAIYKLSESGQDQMFKDLLSSIVYLSGHSLQSLAINDDSSELFEMLIDMEYHPADLRTLKLTGKLLKIPKWLPSLNELIKLNLSVTTLRTDNLVLLSQLQSLFSLTFSVSAANQDPDIAGIIEENKADSGGEIFLPSKGFSKLRLLSIAVPLLPALNFSMNGTPSLERVELRFKRFEGLRGMDKVQKLHDVLITVDATPDKSTDSMLHDLRKSPSEKNVRQYTLTVKEYQG